MAGIDNEQWLDRAGQVLRTRRAARSRDSSFMATGRLIAGNLGLSHAIAAFSGSEAALERQFFDLFDAMCRELRGLQPMH